MENQTDTDKDPDEDKIPIKAYTLKQLARFYGYSVQTIRKWLVPLKSKIGPRIGHFYNPKQVKIIFEHLGNPSLLWGFFYNWLMRTADVDDSDPEHEHDQDPDDDGYDGERPQKFRMWN